MGVNYESLESVLNQFFRDTVALEDIVMMGGDADEIIEVFLEYVSRILKMKISDKQKKYGILSLSKQYEAYVQRLNKRLDKMRNSKAVSAPSRELR